MARARRGNGECTVRKRSDGRWEGRYKDALTQKSKSVYGKTQKEVLAKLEQRKFEYNIGDDKNAVNMNFAEWINLWMKKYNANIKPLTTVSYERIIKNHIIPALGEKYLIELKISDIQDFYEILLKEKELSSKTIKNIHGVLHKCLDKARVLGYVHNNIAEDVVLPKSKKPQLTPIDETNVPIFVQAAMKDEFSDIFLTTLFTGMRQGEVLGLTWDNVDFKRGIITISQQLQKESKKNAKYYLASTKNGKTRRIAPAKFVMDILKARQIKQQKNREKYGELWQAYGEFANLVFTKENGEHLVHSTVAKHCKKILAEIGFPETRFHDLRHTYAIIALQNGDDIKTVQETLGHHSAAFTLDTYAHMTNKMQYDSAMRMNSFISTINV